jgi:Protein of unknown function (DUF2939)
MQKKLLTVGLVSCAFVASGWFYATPYLTFQTLQKAAEAKDTAKISQHVNFPALRESVKSNLNTALTNELGQRQDNPLSAMGAALASTFINPMVDVIVTPEGIATMLKEGSLKPRLGKDDRQEGASPTQISMNYEAFDRFVVKVANREAPTRQTDLILRREGLTWKLSEIRLPQASP